MHGQHRVRCVLYLRTFNLFRRTVESPAFSAVVTRACMRARRWAPAGAAPLLSYLWLYRLGRSLPNLCAALFGVNVAAKTSS